MPTGWARLLLGFVGVTWVGACTVSAPPGPLVAYDRLLSRGMIQVAEENLLELGFSPGPVDGIFTTQTAEALRQYQRRYGLVVSGLLDPATREHLGIERTPGNND